MLISKRATEDFLARELDDWRWVKRLERRELVALYRGWKIRPYFKSDPWVHQLACFLVGMSCPRFLFLLDMGGGKSKLVLDLLHQHMRERTVERGLIITPRRLNTAGWLEAAEQHGSVEPHLVLAHNIEEKWEQLTHPPRDTFTVVDYASLVLAVSRKGKKGKERDPKKMKELRRLYDFVAPDEIHRVKNKDNLWYSVVRELTHSARVSYGLTGTLFGRDVNHAWAQFYLIDKGESLGSTIGLFRSAFFNTEPDPWKGVTYTYREGMSRKLHRMMQHRSLRYEEHELQELPPRVERVRKVIFSTEAREHYLRAVQGLISAEGRLSDMDAQWLRMRQITSGYLEWDDDHGHHLIQFQQQPKLDELVLLVEEALGSTKAVVCYDYTTTGKMIVERLTKEGIQCGWLYGGTKDSAALVQRFLTDPDLQVLVMNSEAGGTGTDGLQRVARALIFYESPPSPITRQQTLKRVHRSGSAGRVHIWDLVMERSVDAQIVRFAAEGRSLHEAIVSGGTSVLER